MLLMLLMMLLLMMLLLLPSASLRFTGSTLLLGLALEKCADQSCSIGVIVLKMNVRAELQLLKVAVTIVSRVDELLAIPPNVPLLNHCVGHASVVEVLHPLSLSLLIFEPALCLFILL